MRKRALSILLCVAMVISMTACGGKSKSLDGYYTCEATDFIGADFALEIDGNDAVLYKHLEDPAPGSVEKTEDGVDIYMTSAFTKHSPFHAKLSEDGEHLYLSSDSGEWDTQVYDRVNKSEFEDYLANSIKPRGYSSNNTETADDDVKPAGPAAPEDNTAEPENEPTVTEPEPEELSDEEAEFREIFWYGYIQNMLMEHDGGISDDELFAEIDSWQSFEKDDGRSVFPQMIKDYFPKMTEEFDTLSDEEKGNCYGIDPFTASDILSVNLKDAYKDFETRKADYLEKYNAGEQSKELAFSSIEVQDNIVFDENGVTITYTGAVLSDDNKNLNFGFHITNNNPDNKRATVMLKCASINGILFMTDGRRDYGTGDFDILVGEEKDMEFEKPGYVDDYIAELPLLGESIETLPVETLSFLYTVKIGKDAEEEAKLTELKTTKYNESDINGLFGTCVAEGHDEKSEGVAVYVKSGDFGVTATAVSTRDYTNINYFEYDVPYAANVSLSFNGNVYTGIYGMAPDELSKTGLTYSAASATVYPGGAVILCNMNITDDIIQNLRREFEIGNSEPVEITLDYLQDNLGQPIPAVIYSK